jgi:hypothetical protein
MIKDTFMNKLFSLLFFLVLSISPFIIQAQDTLHFHNGKKVVGKIISVNEYTITYRYQNEDATQTAGRYAVEKINYQSGRIDDISEKITIDGIEDWEKVMLLEDRTQIAGLKKGSIIRSNTRFLNLHSANTSERKSFERLLKEAAKINSPFLYITNEHETLYPGLIWSIGATQQVKRAVAFGY